VTPAEKQSFSQLLKRYKRPVTIVAVASVLLNLIVFAGSLYMLLVYDSVLPSNSIASLTGLFIMLLVIYVFQALFEALRSDALLGVANGVHDDLFSAVHYAATNQPLKGAQRGGDGMQPIRDLDQVHSRSR
jgi:ATP-binding cassette subfamily C protein PrsD